MFNIVYQWYLYYFFYRDISHSTIFLQLALNIPGKQGKYVKYASFIEYNYLSFNFLSTTFFILIKRCLSDKHAIIFCF